MRVAITSTLALFVAACGGESGRPCEVTEPQPSLATLDCWQEFELQATRPLDSALPGALTIKTIIDQAREDEIHFLDTETYPMHREFAVDHLGWPPDLPFVTEYLYPQRRFLLGSVTYFEEPDVFTYELAPYDTASVEMLVKSMALLSGATYFGGELCYHPVSQEQLARSAELPADISVVTTDELYAGISYQPLNLAETIGQVRILDLDELATGYVSPREIAVLDRVPNDIAVVAGVVTEEFQTPLSHVNVLSQQRGTPNMALRDAQAHFGEYDGQWVRLTVGAFEWSVEPVTQDEADAWWEAHKPTPVEIQAPDYSVTSLVDVDDLTVADIPAVGGKAAQFGELRHITEDVTVRDGLAIPVYFYRQFLEDNGFDSEIAAMLEDPSFQTDGNVRRQRLETLRADMRGGTVNADLLAALEARLSAEFPDTRMRFRSSTNAEDLEGFTGAGLYDSQSGMVGSSEYPIEDALREVWASLWNFRAFEERSYMSIDHLQVAMAMLVYPAYIDETANGVAITANVFDPAPGGEDAFYVNVQLGDVSVVQPPGNGVVPDQLVYYYWHSGQPATYYTTSSLLPAGETVLTRRELFDLGVALAAIRDHFSSIYEPPEGYGRLPMDVEFKRVGQGDAAKVEVKQARPYPGRGASAP